MIDSLLAKDKMAISTLAECSRESSSAIGIPPYPEVHAVFDMDDLMERGMTYRGVAGSLLPGMRTAVLVASASLAVYAAFIQPVQAENRMWVTGENAKRRSCPSMECGVVGMLFYRETVIVYETDHEWSRITGYSNAGCYEGESTFVESGRKDCSKDNGISKGKFAEWVRSDFLASVKPPYEPEIEG